MLNKKIIQKLQEFGFSENPTLEDFMERSDFIGVKTSEGRLPKPFLGSLRREWNPGPWSSSGRLTYQSRWIATVFENDEYWVAADTAILAIAILFLTMNKKSECMKYYKKWFTS